MGKIYWFLDSVPTKDIGLNERDIANSDENYYVIGGIAGDLESVVNIFQSLHLRNDTLGRKFVKKQDNIILANDVLSKLIDSEKIMVFGTVFYHSQIPDVIRENPDKYVADDNPNEVGISGMRGRTYAETIWIMMDQTKKFPEISPVVCLDNEDSAIQQSVKCHFDRQQLQSAQLKVQSINKASQNEPKGYVVCDIVCSMLRNYINSSDKYQILNKLIQKTVKFDSRLETESFDGNLLKVNHKTILVPQWSVLTKSES